jgi:hypothetical protein
MRHMLTIAIGLALCAVLGCDSESQPPQVTKAASVPAQRSQYSQPGRGFVKDQRGPTQHRQVECSGRRRTCHCVDDPPK